MKEEIETRKENYINKLQIHPNKEKKNILHQDTKHKTHVASGITKK